ncbi:ATP-dependent DNA helicase RecG [Candidatus Saccharibacteria bacterium]|nr:ATP-dependent DNA helicase RecG [Candidatus Saccharibacteria bacterium]
MNLATSLSEVKGVGDKTFALLQSAGLDSVGKLIEFLPRKYEDFSKVTPIAEIKPGKATIKAKVTSVNVRQLGWRSSLTTAVLDDGTGRINAVWFNQAYRARQFSHEEFYFSGLFEMRYGRFQLTSPSAEKVKELPVQTGRILPVYMAKKGLKPAVTRKILDELRPFITMLPEFLPAELIKKFQLLPYADALLKIHFPESLQEFETARERLAFNEVFELILAAKLNKQENQKLSGFKIEFNQPKIKEFVAGLPFKMTTAQRRAVWEVVQDFEKAVPMNRLLQGDVGAGKTVVAAAAAYQAHLAGFQVAFAAPTAILAAQHAKTLDQLLSPLGVQVALLTGGSSKPKQETLRRLARGEVNVVVGTHALFEDSVKFKNLGFVVVDEQHRFGVKQRNELLATSGGAMPHLLAMSATPIPRSLQLTLFGDLEISILDESPGGRQPIVTKIWRNSTRNELYALVKKELDEGRQAYVVAPTIEESTEDKTLKSVETVYKAMLKTFARWRVGILHGKMKQNEKEARMSEFKNHELDVLVSTTVIEVGVDVPNATLMMIENAERFGLAQLHQLRGRVGRGEYQSHCFLLPSDIEKIPRRLRYVEESVDGFYLAEKDLELRGPGEIYGAAQHGELDLQVANIADTKLIRTASEATDWFMKNQTLDNFRVLRERVQKLQKVTTLN